MAAPVRNYKKFQRRLAQAKTSCDLFGFVLFDDRPTHAPIRRFCVDNFNWLDDLAGANKMKLFLPLQETEVGFEQEATETAVAPKKEKRLNDGYKNCSLRIAGEFNLTANQLPAFLFFTLKEGQACVEHCAWLQFKPQAFAGEASEGQELLSDLFSAVTIARRSRNWPGR